MKIAFDIDDTLWKVEELTQHNHSIEPGSVAMCLCGKQWRQVPDYDLISVLRWFYNNGEEIFVWSAGGVEYAQVIIDKLGLTSMVRVIPKQKLGDEKETMDITFDDEAIKNGKVNIKVKRPERH
jgi:hypothetical protein